MRTPVAHLDPLHFQETSTLSWRIAASRRHLHSDGRFIWLDAFLPQPGPLLAELDCESVFQRRIRAVMFDKDPRNTGYRLTRMSRLIMRTSVIPVR